MLAVRLLQRQITISNKWYMFEQCKISPLLRKINTSGAKWFSSKSEAKHRPNQIDKYLLVWMKRYPSVAEVPREVSPAVMEKVRNRARIKLTIIFMILTGFACLIMIYSGKQAAKRGESIKKMNLDWHTAQNAKE